MISSENKIAILILAAGSSSRMGQPKQLLKWKETTLLEHSLKIASESLATDTLLVLGAHSELIKKEVSLSEIQWVFNEKWSAGMGSSISLGIHGLLAGNPDLEGVLIMVSDQPLLDTAYLNELILTFLKSPQKIVGTQYAHGIGVPAIFDRSYFGSLQQLHTDKGAREILKQNEKDVKPVNPKGKEIDLDTMKEYLALTKTKAKD